MSEVSPAARNTLDFARIPRASKLLICGLFQKGRVLAQDAVVATLQCDVTPIQLVSAVRTHRRPWHVMIDLLNRAAERYPGPVAHDATGGGSVVAEQVTAREVIDFQMTGRQRRELFISYIAALEHQKLKMPRLELFYREHKYCNVDDLFGNGHPPDTVVACALAYHAFRTGRAPGDYGITI